MTRKSNELKTEGKDVTVASESTEQTSPALTFQSQTEPPTILETYVSNSAKNIVLSLRELATTFPEGPVANQTDLGTRGIATSSQTLALQSDLGPILVTALCQLYTNSRKLFRNKRFVVIELIGFLKPISSIIAVLRSNLPSDFIRTFKLDVELRMGFYRTLVAENISAMDPKHEAITDELVFDILQASTGLASAILAIITIAKSRHA